MVPENPGQQKKQPLEMASASDVEAYQQLNDTFKVYPSKKTVDQLVTEKALAFPFSIAINFEGKEMSYQEMEANANRFAHFLIANGIKNGHVVGLALDRSLFLPIFILGVLKAGGIFQPLDPSYPAQRINYVLQDGGGKMLITSTQQNNLFNNGSIPTFFIEDIIPLLGNYPSYVPEVIRSSSDIIYILHTSGSTGKPKGVLIEHKNVVNLLLSMQDAPGLQANDKLLSITSISFDIFYLELFLPLITGARMVMINSADSKDARAIIHCIQQEKVTILQTVPSFWNTIITLSGNMPLPLKAICGGEPLSKDLAKKMLGKLDEVWNVYGPTEATIWASVKKLTLQDEIISIGKPIYNTRFYILDEEKQLVKAGDIGEIFIAGDNVGRGYLNLPTVTEERFLVDTITKLPNQRMYQTGDMGKLLENGEVQCLGRVDQQIKINGFRIELGEIEHAIATEHASVKQVVVQPFTNKNDITQLVAYFTLQTGSALLTNQSWKKLLKEHLPYYMIPEHYVVMDDFPLTPNGKIDKNSLTMPENLQHSLKKHEGTTATEYKVMDIWAEALGKEEVGIDEDFFEIGGHSLIAAQVMQQIENATGKKLPLAILFENATIKTLSKAINDQKENISYKSLVAINTKGTKTPVFVVHGSGLNILMFYPLAKYLDEDQPLYGLQALGLDGSTIEGDTIEALAKLYNEELLEAVPGNAYAIVGYSLGGVIAFEMAKQLKAMGKKVNFLGIIDTYLDNEDYHMSWFGRYKTKAFRQPKKLAFGFSSLFRYPQKAIAYQWYISKYKISNLFGKLNPKPKKEVTLEDKIVQHYEQAYIKYKLTPYDDKLFLFKADERIYYVDDPKNLGWVPYAPKGLVLNTVPGDHKTFLLPPNDKVFADKLQALLNNALNEDNLH